MNIKIGTEQRAKLQEGMIGLFFEDINYAADEIGRASCRERV